MQEDDPIHDEHLAAVEALVGRPLSPLEYEGFLIVGNRFVDRSGNSRIDNLAKVFDTHRIEGKRALAASLEEVARNLGSYDKFAERYPVTIIPPLPAFPLFPIVGVEDIRATVYRILDSRSRSVLSIKSTNRLPLLELPVEPVLRTPPRAHWCSYEKWHTPDETRRSLQILPEWSNCEARATLRTTSIKGLSFVAYSQDPNDPETRGLKFHGYFFEGLTQDHEEYHYSGDAVQICVYGEPLVEILEEWDSVQQAWQIVFQR